MTCSLSHGQIDKSSTVTILVTAIVEGLKVCVCGGFYHT